jgi:hypothetical protein
MRGSVESPSGLRGEADIEVTRVVVGAGFVKEAI